VRPSLEERFLHLRKKLLGEKNTISGIETGADKQRKVGYQLCDNRSWVT